MNAATRCSYASIVDLNPEKRIDGAEGHCVPFSKTFFTKISVPKSPKIKNDREPESAYL